MSLAYDITRTFNGFMSRVGTYLLGKGGLVGVGILGASVFGGGPWLIGALAVGGATVSCLMHWQSEQQYKIELLDTYREEISTELGLPAKALTLDHLKEAAQSNVLLTSALAHKHTATLIGYGTAMLASAISFGLIAIGNAHQGLGNWATEYFSEPLAKGLNFMAASLVSGVTGLIAHDGLSLALGHTLHEGAAAAHHHVLEMKWKLAKGHPITQEEVFGIVASANTQLHAAIQKECQLPYEAMNLREQRAVLASTGMMSQIDALTQQINAGTINPARIAYYAAEPQKIMPAAPTEMPEAPEPKRTHFRDRFASRTPHPATHAERILAAQAASPPLAPNL